MVSPVLVKAYIYVEAAPPPPHTHTPHYNSRYILLRPSLCTHLAVVEVAEAADEVALVEASPHSPPHQNILLRQSLSTWPS